MTILIPIGIVWPSRYVEEYYQKRGRPGYLYRVTEIQPTKAITVKARWRCRLVAEVSFVRGRFI